MYIQFGLTPKWPDIPNSLGPYWFQGENLGYQLKCVITFWYVSWEYEVEGNVYPIIVKTAMNK